MSNNFEFNDGVPLQEQVNPPVVWYGTEGGCYTEEHLREMKQRANGLLSHVGRKTLWRLQNPIVSPQSLASSLRMCDTSDIEMDLLRALLYAEHKMETVYHRIVRLSVRQMSFQYFPKACDPIKLDTWKVLDDVDWNGIVAIKEADDCPEWLSTDIGVAQTYFDLGTTPFQISYLTSNNASPTYLTPSDGSYVLSNTRKPARITSGRGWPSESGYCCMHSDSIKVRYTAGYLTEDDLRCNDPQLYQNLLTLAAWSYAHADEDPEGITRMMGNLRWRA